MPPLGLPGPTTRMRRTTSLPDRHGDPVQQLALQGAQLGGPRRRLGLQHQLAVAQRERGAVVGDVGADELRPAAQDRRVGQPGRPPAVQRHPGHQPAERLRVAVVRARARPPPPPARAATGRRTSPTVGLRSACALPTPRGRAQRLAGEVGPSRVGVRPIGSGTGFAEASEWASSSNGRPTSVPRAGDNRPGFSPRRAVADGRRAVVSARSSPVEPKLSTVSTTLSTASVGDHTWGADVAVCGELPDRHARSARRSPRTGRPRGRPARPPRPRR